MPSVRNNPITPSAPAWQCPAGKIASLIQRRTARRIMRSLYKGDWRTVLLTLGNTAHRFRAVTNHAGKTEALVTKINIIKRAIEMHADIAANRPPSFTVGEEFSAQSDAIAEIRRRSLFDARFHESMVKCGVEAEAPLIAMMHADSGGAVIAVGSNDEWLPVGDAGPDGQPSVWERRWCVERGAGSANRRRFLRVERHRLVDGGHVVEQEAYKVKHIDSLSDLRGLTRVPLSLAFDDPSGVPEQVVVTGLDTLPIAQLVRYRYEDEPCPMLSLHELDIVDALAAAVSRLDRANEIHGNAKLRVAESMLDPKTGMIDSDIESVVDPDGEFGYILAQYNFDSLLKYVDRISEWMLVGPLAISPSLLGMKLSGGAAPDSFDKLRLEASNTMSAAERAVPYIASALGRVMTAATQIESNMPIRGFAVGHVSAMVYPELPRDNQQRSRDVAEQRNNGLLSELTALELVHGAEKAQIEFDRLAEERNAQSELDRSALFGAVPPADPFTALPDGDTQ